MTRALSTLAVLLCEWFDVFVLRHRWYWFCNRTAHLRGWEHMGPVLLRKEDAEEAQEDASVPPL